MPGERRCRRRTRKGFFPRKPRSVQGGRDLFDIIDKEEWKEWIASGEKKNAYVPSDPDVLYEDDWTSWDDFLNGEIESLSDIMRPGYKRGR